MKPETIFSNYFLHVMKKNLSIKNWHATRFESLLIRGIPDISFSTQNNAGWIELKYIPSFPVRLNTLIRLRNLTQEQYDFLDARNNLTGSCFIFIKVKHRYSAVYFLFDFKNVDKLQRGLTRTEFYSLSVVNFQHKIDALKMYRILDKVSYG